MALSPITILSTFTGIGMLDAAVRLALEARGIASRTACYIEWEAAATAALVARMEAKAVDQAPVWDDICTFDARPWRGSVDILIGGPPCQPYSNAGKRIGNTDERSHGTGEGPLVHLARVIDESRPALVFFENVPAWITGGHFRLFGEELSILGYEIQDPVFLASEDVGASQDRERVFIMASDNSNRWQAERGHKSDRQRDDQSRNGELADSTREGREGPFTTDKGIGRTSEQRFELGNSEDAESHWSMEQEEARGRGSTKPDVALYPPGRNDFGRWAAVLSVDATKAPAIESGVSVVADGLAFSNADLLRIGGNGVDPLVAAVAFGVLWDRLMDQMKR